MTLNAKPSGHSVKETVFSLPLPGDGFVSTTVSFVRTVRSLRWFAFALVCFCFALGVVCTLVLFGLVGWLVLLSVWLVGIDFGRLGSAREAFLCMNFLLLFFCSNMLKVLALIWGPLLKA